MSLRSKFSGGGGGGGGAGSSWFVGSSGSNPSILSSVRLFVVCMTGLMLMNFVFRGNVSGKCQDETEVVLPIRLQPRSVVPVPEGYGFVDGNEDPAEGTTRGKRGSSTSHG